MSALGHKPIRFAPKADIDRRSFARLQRDRAYVALVHHCDDRPIAAMAGRIIAAELGRIEPRRHASVEKEGIPAAEAVAEKTGEVVKVHHVFGDDEMHLQAVDGKRAPPASMTAASAPKDRDPRNAQQRGEIKNC
jgi:hypothetical protein